MEAHVEDDVEVDTTSHTIPDTGDVVEADTSSGTPSHTIPDMEDVVEVDTLSDAPSDTPSDTILDRSNDELDTEDDSEVEIPPRRTTRSPVPPEPNLSLVGLATHVIAMANAWKNCSTRVNLPTATRLQDDLEMFKQWACLTDESRFERLDFVDTLRDHRAYEIAQHIHDNLSMISQLILFLRGLEWADESLMIQLNDPLYRSPFEPEMLESRRELVVETSSLKDLSETTNQYWPGPAPLQNGAR